MKSKNTTSILLMQLNPSCCRAWSASHLQDLDRLFYPIFRSDSLALIESWTAITIGTRPLDDGFYSTSRILVHLLSESKESPKNFPHPWTQDQSVQDPRQPVSSEYQAGTKPIIDAATVFLPSSPSPFAVHTIVAKTPIKHFSIGRRLHEIKLSSLGM
ncbi:hypothetical protein BDW74DRAFT_121462 [Aspergillus multicolor]|uniref:uncharacterized protein n=1 Tax=Aspergillus multicolor TaxID=41759 RepID=UPI003CCDF111